ncbi:MAG: LON peptidase substrate-binding domain-containing protein [Caldilineaceae bacterium]|nr:LON peptidase substrate-binding domain-containing protein [Caldilineaceae bacterium]
MKKSHRRSPLDGGQHEDQRTDPMDMPLFPLNVVLFPGMMLPLHIFEPRYREMIERCVQEDIPFGVVLIEEGDEVGGSAKPYPIGTAARIVKVDRLADGGMNITAVGTQRFRILELDNSHSYLSAKVAQYPIVNGSTKAAAEMAYRVRPKIIEYVALLSEASQTELKLDRLPEDPTTLAFLVAIALQVDNRDKQKLLALAGVPEILDRERYLLSCELLLLRYMVETQGDLGEMSSGPTGYIFAN